MHEGTVLYLLLKSLFIFRQRGREEEREGRKHQFTQALVACPTPPAGDLAPNPGMCPDWESNQWPSRLQDNTKPNWATPVRATVLYIDCTGDSAIDNIFQNSQNCTLEKVNYILCILHLIKNFTLDLNKYGATQFTIAKKVNYLEINSILFFLQCILVCPWVCYACAPISSCCRERQELESF